MSDDGNLRESLGLGNSFFREEEEEDETQPTLRAGKAGSGLILGMTAPQRFVVALMVFLLTCIIGTLVLILADKIVLPF